MGRVTSLFARKVVEQVEGRADKDALLRTLGLERGGPVDSAHMIEDAEYYAFLERAAEVDANPTTLPLRAGAAMRCDDYGAFGLAWKSATTLRGSYDRAERYALVLTSVAMYEVEPTFNGAFMHLHRGGERRLGLRLSNEATLASIVSISREVASSPFRAEEVHIKHEAPDSIDGHEAYFGCPVRFESDRDALVVSTRTLRTPNKRGDANIVEFFDAHLAAEVDKVDDSIGLDREVRELVTTSLSEGVPLLSDVASQLAMSGRTLQRRLSEEGCAFQALVDEARRDLAKRLLRDTDYSLIEVAFMTGFSEQSALTRAFKRWVGRTPGAFRSDCRSGGASD
jgi:AraC-like DNA-binding protein